MVTPGVVCDCGKGVLATLSKFSDFVLVLQTTILVLIPGFQEMVIPRGWYVTARMVQAAGKPKPAAPRTEIRSPKYAVHSSLGIAPVLQSLNRVTRCERIRVIGAEHADLVCKKRLQ